jgi:TetR/AcrR family transcriptional repressor of nem operon
MDRKLQFFVSAVRDAAAQGLIETADPVVKAQALFSSYQGTIAQARIQNDIDLIRDFKHIAREVLGVKQAQAVAT